MKYIRKQFVSCRNWCFVFINIRCRNVTSYWLVNRTCVITVIHLLHNYTIFFSFKFVIKLFGKLYRSYRTTMSLRAWVGTSTDKNHFPYPLCIQERPRAELNRVRSNGISESQSSHVASQALQNDLREPCAASEKCLMRTKTVFKDVNIQKN